MSTTKTRAEELADALQSNFFSGNMGREVWDEAAAELRRLAAVEAERDRLNRLLDEAVTRYDQMTDWFKSAQQKAANAMAERDRLAAEVSSLRSEVEALRADAEPERRFPMQRGPSIPWTLAEAIYAGYSALYGTDQSLQRLAERGGFSWPEVEHIYNHRDKRSKAAIDAAIDASRGKG